MWFDVEYGFLKPKALAEILKALSLGKVLILPSDSGYALVCRLGDKKAIERIRRLRDLDKHHFFTLLCADLNALARYSRVDNVQFRLLKRLFPGAFTCILPASREVPRLLQDDKRKSVGIRVPDHDLLLTILSAYGEAVMAVSLSDASEFWLDLDELPKSILHAVDGGVNVGACINQPSTVLDLTVMPPVVIRQGAGVF